MSLLSPESVEHIRPKVILANPLPSALAHYAVETEIVLNAAGVDCRTAPVPSVEVGVVGLRSKLVVAARTIRAHRELVRESNGHLLVLWPAFGHLEPLTWFAKKAAVSVIVHDPTPLRKQHGLGKMAGRAGRARSGAVETIVLSVPAHTTMQDLGWSNLTRLPMPTSVPVAISDHVRSGVAVLGQFKPSRDVAALKLLGQHAHDYRHRLLIAGRGWPRITGWAYDDRFIPEDELAVLFERSAAVVVPYTNFYQSSIAIRALESHTPVVVPRHPMIEEVFGKNWPGIVEHENDWPAALTRALAVESEQIAALHRAHWNRTVLTWKLWAQTLSN